MYQKMSEECKRSLKRQFDFSMLELDQMESFTADNLSKSAVDILDVLMKSEDLNDKQKVIISYTLGTAVGAESVMQDLEENSMAKVSPMLNMQIGQGG
jgi:hypothetical protein